jgi:hypothetical protein
VQLHPVARRDHHLAPFVVVGAGRRLELGGNVRGLRRGLGEGQGRQGQSKRGAAAAEEGSDGHGGINLLQLELRPVEILG